MAEQVASKNTYAHKLAHWLDDRFTIPGTDIKFGLDPVISLIPGAGDVASGMISSYFLVLAVRQDVPGHIIFRMAMNILIDVLIGAIPVLGDIFDFNWKANIRNAELLDQYS